MKSFFENGFEIKITVTLNKKTGKYEAKADKMSFCLAEGDTPSGAIRDLSDAISFYFSVLENEVRKEKKG